MTKLLRSIALTTLFLFDGLAAAQTLTLRDAGGGALAPPVAHGGYLYVGSGATLNTWDMSDPTQPVYDGRTSEAPAPGPIRGLAMVGDYLYASWNSPDDTGGILVFSLADPAHPAEVASIDDYIASDFKRPAGLAVSGNTVYLGDADNGLVVLDATDPLNPVFVSTVDGVFEFDTMAAFGDRLLTSGSSFIGGRVVHVIDITDPAAPVELGNTSMDGTSVLRAVLTDGYAIGVGNDLLVYDLSDPSNIQQVFSTPIDQATQAIRSGDVLYLVGASGIQVWDFSTPSAPGLLRTVPMDAFAPDQAADAPFGPVILTHLDRGLVLDVADPLNPALAASFTLPVGVSVHGADFEGAAAYLAEEGYGLSVVDASTLAPVGRYDADLPDSLAARDMEDIAVDNGRAYLAAWGYGVLIADVSDPASPAELGRFEFPFASAIAVKDDLVYVASTTNGGIFRILDAGDPAAPVELGSLLTSKTMDLAVRGTDAFLADGADFGDGGLRVVDVSDPEAPAVTGQYTACTYADGIDVSADGNTTYLACASDEEFHGSLHIVDTSDRHNPAVIGTYVVPGSEAFPDYNTVHAVRVAGNVAYVGHDYGVDEIDISDPANPQPIARHPTGYSVRQLSLAPDGTLYAFAGEAGTFVFAPIAAPDDTIFANGFD